jgi:hypothetical protein
MLGLSASDARSQEVEASVSVNSDRISPAGREEVAGFADELQRYLNSTRFTSSEWEGEKVRMNFNVIFVGESGDGRYSVNVMVGSQRNVFKSASLSPMMKVFDEAWSFRYTRNQPLQQSPTGFDEITSVVDFYVYLALGFDLDSYDDQGGTAMFDRARDIAQRAQIRPDASGWSSDVKPGRYSRYGLVRELTDMRYLPIRRFLFDYHYSGLDIEAEQGKQAALDSINTFLSDLVVAVDKLVGPSTILRVVTDAKHLELAQLFAGYSDTQVWRKLMYIDPGHQTVYEEARDRRH